MYAVQRRVMKIPAVSSREEIGLVNDGWNTDANDESDRSCVLCTEMEETLETQRERRRKRDNRGSKRSTKRLTEHACNDEQYSNE